MNSANLMIDSRPVVRVEADDREQASGVVDALRRRRDVDLHIRRLPEGDYLVADRFLVERKTLPDFSDSVIDGRLFAQAARISGSTCRGILILEGTPRGPATPGASRTALQGALITVGVFFGLTVLRSANPTETASLLICLARQACRTMRGALPRPGMRPRGRRARQLYLLQGLPGVGPGRAERLLDHFKSVARVAAAPADELAGVEGVGPATARNIRWVLDEPRGPFLL